MVTLEDRHTIACAISTDRRVACWGWRVGTNHPDVELRANAATPYLLAGVDDVVDVAVSGDFLCVARATAPSGCFAHWAHIPAPEVTKPVVELGSLERGICARYGDGTIACTDGERSKTQFAAIAGIAGATSLSCIENTCCAVAGDGATKCFGEGLSQHGIEESADARPLPDQPKARTLALAYHAACLLTDDGTTSCWGDATSLTGRRGVRAVRVFDEGVCLMLDAGGMECSRSRFSASVLESKDPPVPAPVDVSGRCLVHGGGAVSCWGDNASGELGDGHPMFVATPQKVAGLDDVVELRIAEESTCAIRRDKSIQCWGREPRPTPTPTPGVSRRDALPGLDTTEHPVAVRMYAIDAHDDVCIVERSGAVHCLWQGQDEWLRLRAPRPVVELQPMYGGFCARFADGTVGMFEFDGEDADTEEIAALPRAKLERIGGITGAKRVIGSEYGCYALTKDGRILGMGNAAAHETKQASGLTGVTDFAAHDAHKCAIVKHQIWCWGGENRFGEIGDGIVGDWAHAMRPVLTKATFNAVAIAVGPTSSCAIDETGHVWCWGDDRDGQLGSKRPLASEGLVRVVGLGPSRR